MGGADRVVAAARVAFEEGDYRWVAEVVKHVVFADPSHRDGRELLADALEQLGYQAETGPWRNFYLTGAKELRDGVRELPTPNTASPDSVRAMKLDTFLDYLGIRLNGPRATGKRITVNIALRDTGDRAVLALANGSLSHSLDRQDPAADATLTMARAALDDIILGTSTLPDAIAAGVVELDGDADAVRELHDLLDTFSFWFNIVTP
jgi:alkyl sulfatase BDS1-like metallo-beta-lactamase superfamily hydrolase